MGTRQWAPDVGTSRPSGTAPPPGLLGAVLLSLSVWLHAGAFAPHPLWPCGPAQVVSLCFLPPPPAPLAGETRGRWRRLWGQDLPAHGSTSRWSSCQGNGPALQHGWGKPCEGQGVKLWIGICRGRMAAAACGCGRWVHPQVRLQGETRKVLTGAMPGCAGRPDACFAARGRGTCRWGAVGDHTPGEVRAEGSPDRLRDSARPPEDLEASARMSPRRLEGGCMDPSEHPGRRPSLRLSGSRAVRAVLQGRVSVRPASCARPAQCARECLPCALRVPVGHGGIGVVFWFLSHFGGCRMGHQCLGPTAAGLCGPPRSR